MLEAREVALRAIKRRLDLVQIRNRVPKYLRVEKSARRVSAGISGQRASFGFSTPHVQKWRGGGF